MQKISIKNFELCERTLENLEVILDDSGTIVLLPLLYNAYLSFYGFSIGRVITDEDGKRISRLEQNPIGVKTCHSYTQGLFRFIGYVNNLAASDASYHNVHELHLIRTSVINFYLNNFLPTTMSLTSLTRDCSALQSFFNFLTWMKIRPLHDFNLSRAARGTASANNHSSNLIQYVSKENRSALLFLCNSHRDRLILRMGFEVGLRSSELQGIRLHQVNQKQEGLLSLFEKLRDHQQSRRTIFSFNLSGKFAKGGRSRTIYFSRDLLTDMYDYFQNERLRIVAHSDVKRDLPDLFLRTDNGFVGEPIGPRQGSNTFTMYRRQLPHLNSDLGYHCLRHTFATELYHEELRSNSGRETRSESAALLTVAIRLGHKLGKNGLPQAVTTRYIRMREQMLEIEDYAA